jgi:hypothetical protein
VTNPVIQESRMKKHVLYTINGSDAQGGFSVERRYKEFEQLRNIMVFNWPGCFIPGLP